ncbi:hypothetical protein IAT38_001414 [Cryptococcus sp. DSM 104549]
MGMSIKSFSGAFVFIVIFLAFTLIGVGAYCDKNAKKKNAAAASTLPTHHSRSHHRRTANQGLAQSNAQSQRIHLTLNGDLLAQVNAARTRPDGTMRLVPLTHPPEEDPVMRTATASSSATQLPEYAPVAPPIPPAPAYQAPLRVRNVDPADLSTSTVNTIPDVPRAPPPAYNTVIVGGGGSAV